MYEVKPVKKLVIKLIEKYQDISKHKTPSCRYKPTCSQYAKEAYQTRNFFYAGLLSIWRILRCNPFSKGGYDPVPKKKKKGKDTMHYLDITLDGSDQQTHKLRDYKGKKVVLYFYPKDSTSGCTIEGRQFTNLKDEFEKKNAVIIGVSKDSIKSHQKFCEEAGLDILLLSDKDELLVKAFDVLKEKKMYGKTFMGIMRSTFVLDEAGNIVKKYLNVKPEGHAEAVLADL